MQKRILSVFCAVVLFSTLILTASAAVELPDFDRRGSISISLTYKGRPLTSGAFALYRVGDVYSENANYFFRYTEEFEHCEVPVDDPSTSKVAEALAEIVRENRLRGTEQRVDKKGTVTFEDLEIGLYLVIQTRTASGFSRISPFLVSVPSHDGSSYVYDVDASPKMDLEPEPTTKPSTEPTSGDWLPQTGQTNWPVPMLASCGMLLLALGWYLYFSGRKQSNEG